MAITLVPQCIKSGSHAVHILKSLIGYALCLTILEFSNNKYIRGCACECNFVCVSLIFLQRRAWMLWLGLWLNIYWNFPHRCLTQGMCIDAVINDSLLLSLVKLRQKRRFQLNQSPGLANLYLRVSLLCLVAIGLIVSNLVTANRATLRLLCSHWNKLHQSQLVDTDLLVKQVPIGNEF